MASGNFVDKYELANKWLRLQNRGISVLKGLKDKGITQIILYGASEFALRLMEQCENENHIVRIIGIADKRISSKGAYYKEIPLLSMDDLMEHNGDGVCIVITAMGFSKAVAKELQENGNRNFISLRDLIEDAYYFT